MFNSNKSAKEVVSESTLQEVRLKREVLQDDKKIEAVFKKALISEYNSLLAYLSYVGIIIAAYMSGKLGLEVGSASEGAYSKYVYAILYSFIPITIIAGIFVAFYTDVTSKAYFDIKTRFINLIGFLLISAIMTFNFVSIQHDIGNTYEDINNVSEANAAIKENLSTSATGTKASLERLSSLNLKTATEYEVEATKLLRKNAKAFRSTRKCKRINTKLNRRTRRKYTRFCDKYSQLKINLANAIEKAKLEDKLNLSTTNITRAKELKVANGGSSNKFISKVLQIEEKTVKENKSVVISILTELIFEILAIIHGFLASRNASKVAETFRQDLILGRREKQLENDELTKLAKEQLVRTDTKLSIAEKEAELELVKANTIKTAYLTGNSIDDITGLTEDVPFNELPTAILISRYIKEECNLEGNMSNTVFVDKFNGWVLTNRGLSSQFIDHGEIKALLAKFNCSMSNEGLISGLSLKV